MNEPRQVGISTMSPEEDRRFRLHGQLRQIGGDPSQLLSLLAIIVAREDWKHLVDAEGQPLTFRDYLVLPYPVGIGWSEHDVLTVLQLRHRHEEGQVTDAERVEEMRTLRERVYDLLGEGARGRAVTEGEGSAELAAVGEIGNGRRRDNYIIPTRQGTDATYLSRRLARDFPEIHARLQAGEFRSVRAAALEAGIIPPTLTVPKEPRAIARALRKHLDDQQIAEVLRLLSEEKRKAA